MNGHYAGRQVVGMDLHRRRSVLVRMTEDGRKLGTARITNSPAALRAEIARAGQLSASDVSFGAPTVAGAHARDGIPNNHSALMVVEPL